MQIHLLSRPFAPELQEDLHRDPLLLFVQGRHAANCGMFVRDARDAQTVGPAFARVENPFLGFMNAICSDSPAGFFEPGYLREQAHFRYQHFFAPFWPMDLV